MRIGDVDAEIGDVWEIFVKYSDGIVGIYSRVLILDIVVDRVGPIAWCQFLRPHPFTKQTEGFERFVQSEHDLLLRRYELLARV